MRKGLLASLLVVVLIISGWTSTSPSLRDAYLQEITTESLEGKTIVKLSIDHSFQEELEAALGADAQILSILQNVLQSGIEFEYKGSVSGDVYYKMSLVDSELLEQLPFWNSDFEAAIEYIVKTDGKIYIRIASEVQWIDVGISDAEAAELAEYFSMNESMIEFIKQFVTEFFSSFDLKLRSLEDKGTVAYETPAGTVDVKHLYIELTMDDLFSIVTSLVQHLLEYDGWEALIKGLEDVMTDNTDFEPMSDEEIEFAVTAMQEGLTEVLPILSFLSEDMIEAQLGADLEFLVKSDIYLKPDATMTANHTTVDFSYSDPETNDYVALTLSFETDRWNVNEVVETPVPEHVWTIEEVAELALAGKLPEDSIFNLLLATTRSGELTIGSDMLLVTETNVLDGSEMTYSILLEAPPYITQNGNTMVPVKAINDIVGSEAQWNNETKEATFAIGSNEVRVKVNSEAAYVNGAEVEMPEQVVIVNSRTFVPLRFISENLGAEVIWNQSLQTIDISF